MRGPHPTEGRVNWNYRNDGGDASNYGRSGYMDVPPNLYNSNKNPNNAHSRESIQHLCKRIP